jgi:hypothetical protein
MFSTATFAYAHSWNKNGIASVGIDIYKLNTPGVTIGERPPMPLACIAWRLHRSVCGHTSDRRPSPRRLSYRARDATASFFRRAPSRGRFRFRRTIAGMAWFGARTRSFFSDSGNAIADRRDRSE